MLQSFQWRTEPFGEYDIDGTVDFGSPIDAFTDKFNKKPVKLLAPNPASSSDITMSQTHGEGNFSLHTLG